MATGKYLSLEEARKEKKLDRFIKEHPSTGDELEFDLGLKRMIEPSKDKNRDNDR